MDAQTCRLAGNGSPKGGRLGDRLAAPIEHGVHRMAGQRCQQCPEQRTFEPPAVSTMGTLASDEMAAT